MNHFTQRMQQFINEVDEEVFAKYKIDRKIFEEMIKKYGDISEINQIRSRLNFNYEKLMRVEKPGFNFMYPKEITKNLYI